MHSVCVALKRDIFGARVQIATLVESVLLIHFLHLMWLGGARIFYLLMLPHVLVVHLINVHFNYNLPTLHIIFLSIYKRMENTKCVVHICAMPVWNVLHCQYIYIYTHVYYTGCFLTDWHGEKRKYLTSTRFFSFFLSSVANFFPQHIYYDHLPQTFHTIASVLCHNIVILYTVKKSCISTKQYF